MRLNAIATETAKFEAEKAKYETYNDLNKVAYIHNPNPYPTLTQYRNRFRIPYPNFVKRKRKAVCLENMVTKQDVLIVDLKHALL